MILPLLAFTLANTAPAPAPAPLPAPPQVDCADADHAAFNFWIGTWTVSDTASGSRVATSRIEPVVGGCAIRETYHQTVGPAGKPLDYQGTSYSAFNAIDQVWRQYYVDNGGTAAVLTGGMKDGAMVLDGRNGPVSTRMTVRAQPDGTVRQSGQASTDGGKTWQPGYDFTYRKM